MERSNLLKLLFGVNALAGLAVGYLVWQPILSAEMPVWMPWSIPTLLMLNSILGFGLVVYTPIPMKQTEDVESKGLIENEPVSSDKQVALDQEVVAPLANETSQVINLRQVSTADQDTTRLFLERFYERFGSFYSDIQQIEGHPDDGQKQQIRRRMVEMALHAYSFVRLSKLNRLHRPYDEPNLLLLLNQRMVGELENVRYRLFTTDAYQTEKRYRFLQKVLLEMDVGSLEAFLEDVYVPAEFLSKS